MVTITRRIQLLFNTESKDELKELYARIYGWQRIVHKAANWIATHQYIQSEIQNIHYISEGVKIKLADMKKDADGILTCSRDNTTYQVLSKAFKGECPMGMLSGLNTIITKTVKQDIQDIRFGKKTLRTYRDNIPMPVRSADISQWMKNEDGNYSFFVYGTSFRTFFGRDFSGNEIIMDRCMAGEYKLCDSSIQIKGNKIFLLAVFQFEKKVFELDNDKELRAELDVNVPIKFKIGAKEYKIGHREEFLYRRLQIQQSLRNAQASCRYNKGGKGRKKKMQAIERFTEMEKNYVTTRIHQYTAKLIDWCLKLKCKKIILVNQVAKEEEAKRDEEYLLRNWGYYGLKEKLRYKCYKFGINLIEE